MDNTNKTDYDDYPLRMLMPPEFPFLLRQIPDPPKMLWVKGNCEYISAGTTRSNSGAYGSAGVGIAGDSRAFAEIHTELPKFLCVIGSRRYSGYGKEACEKLIAGLRGYPIVIVSGMAIGMDSIAHKAAIENGLLTIAVPGSGLHRDVLYPRSHFALANRILEADGTLVSELEPETSAARWTFPGRNRIMAGLCHATLVVEGAARSGTLITSRLALEYNREVLAVPGSIFSEHTGGVHGLVEQGARLVTSSQDILETLGLTEAPTAQAKMEHLFNDCSKEELAILKLLSEPLARDKLVEKSGFSAAEVNSLLGHLELKGIVKERAGEFSIL